MLYCNDGSEARPESHAASLGGPPGTPSTGAASSCRHRAGDPASLRYAAVPQVGRDSRALHGEMSEDRSRPPSTARLRRRILATIFFIFFALKINVLFLYIYIHLSIHLLQTSI